MLLQILRREISEQTICLLTKLRQLLLAQKNCLVSVLPTSWDRKVLDTSLASIIGSVSSEKAGLPAEEVDAYLKKGYSLNDRVGTSLFRKAIRIYSSRETRNQRNQS